MEFLVSTRKDCIHEFPELREFQSKSLYTLALYLLSGNLKAHFSMARFSSTPSITQGSQAVERTMQNCGTVGCAVGHGPYAGIEKYVSEDFIRYAYRCFGAEDNRIWNFCFDADWTYSSNSTAADAGNRILYMLKHGIPVELEYEYFKRD